MQRFDRLDAFITRQKVLPPKEKSYKNTSRNMFIVLAATFAAIALEILLLKATGQLEPLLSTLGEYVVLGITCLVLLCAALALLLSRAYSTYLWFHTRFDNVEREFMKLGKDIEAGVEDVEKLVTCKRGKASCAVQ
jgi:hypothetical protein